MKTNSHLASALAAALLLFQQTRADLCTLRPNMTDFNFYGWDTITVSSQEELARSLDGCDTVVGNVMVTMDFEGPFNLEVTNFTGTISQPTYYAPNITELFMPKATYIHAINLQNLPELKTLFLPEVTEMDTLILSGNGTTKVVCGYLENAGVIDIQGNAVDANFSMLSQVDYLLSIGAAYTSPNLVLDFPSLMNATSISLVGNISSLSMPNLAVALSEDWNSGLYNNFGLMIASFGSALAVDFPSLYNATGIQLMGDIQSLSFPSLVTLNGLFSMTTDSPLDVDLPDLESVMAISLEGQISSFSMPAIKDIQSWVEITSEINLDCSTSHAQWAAANNSYIPGTLDTGGVHHYSCKGGSTKKPIPKGAIVGIVFGILLIIAVPVLVYARMIMKKRLPSLTAMGIGGKKDVKAPVSAYEHELDLRSPRGEAPPAYAESVQSEIGPPVEPKSHV